MGKKNHMLYLHRYKKISHYLFSPTIQISYILFEKLDSIENSRSQNKNFRYNIHL